MEWCLTAASWEWESRSSRGLSRPPGGGRCSCHCWVGAGAQGPHTFTGARWPKGHRRLVAASRVAFLGTVLREGAPLARRRGRPDPLGLPRRHRREERGTAARGAEEPRFSDGRPDATDWVSTVCSDSPRLWPGLPQQRRRGWSRGCLPGLCWWSGFAAVVFFCALWLEPRSYHQKAFNLGRLSFFGSFSCKEEAFFLFCLFVPTGASGLLASLLSSLW